MESDSERQLRENHQLGQSSVRNDGRGNNNELSFDLRASYEVGARCNNSMLSSGDRETEDVSKIPSYHRQYNSTQHNSHSNQILTTRPTMTKSRSYHHHSDNNNMINRGVTGRSMSPPEDKMMSPVSRLTKQNSNDSNQKPWKSKFTMFFKELANIKATIVDGTNNLFAKWALIVYRRPYIVIGSSLVVAILCSVGLFPGMTEWIDGAENLYSLPYSVARDHQGSHSFFFGESNTRKNLIIVTKKDGLDKNILTWESLAGIDVIDNLIRGRDIDSQGRLIRIPNVNLPGEYLIFDDICAKDPWRKCLAQNVLSFGIEDWHTIMGKSKPSDMPEVFVFNGLAVNPTTSQFFVPEYFLGGTDIHDCVRDIPSEAADLLVKDSDIIGSPSPGKKRCNIQCINSVEAYLLNYDEIDRPEFLFRNESWEKVLIDTLVENEYIGDLSISTMAFRSRDDELQASTAESNDIVYVVLTFVILVSYSSALNFSCDLYRSKSYPALAGAGAASLGLLAGMGFVSLCQVPMVPTVLICPFLVMGIGVDDMFVIINSYSLSYMVQSAEERCIVSLKDSGLSITITTTTNLIAFAVGAFSPYLSIKNFCIYSACSLAMGYFFVLTFFFAFLCLDAKREEATKVCLFCLPKKTEKQHRLENELASMTAEEQKRQGSLQQISTFSLVTYKVQLSVNERAQKSAVLAQHSINEPPHNETRTVLSSVDSNLRYISNRPYSENNAILQPSAKPQPNHNNSGLAKHALSAFDPMLVKQAVYDEPKGNVGRLWRLFFLNKYGPFLMNRYVKIVVCIIFSVFFAVSVYGFTELKQGLNLAELSPPDSYLRKFDYNLERYFTKFDTATDIFFADYVEWWKPEVQNTLRALTNQLKQRESTMVVVSPLIQMLDDPTLSNRLRAGSKEVFEVTLYNVLKDETSFYKQFEYDFFWRGKELYTWRFKVLPRYMATSEQRAAWMQEIRSDAVSQQNAEPPLKAIPYTYMMIFYESDLEILSSVLINMVVAAVAMLLVAFLLIPQLVAGLLVIGIMVLIDIGLFGFMYFWDVKLNMVSMINLVISIGFAVDYSAHMCHTFTHCEGGSRDLRVIETLVLMGTPVLHGAASTLLGVLMMGFSTSYVFTIFFKMMVMVIGFGSTHGLILLPVLLSYFGQLDSHGSHSSHDESESQIVNTDDMNDELIMQGSQFDAESIYQTNKQNLSLPLSYELQSRLHDGSSHNMMNLHSLPDNMMGMRDITHNITYEEEDDQTPSRVIHHPIMSSDPRYVKPTLGLTQGELVRGDSGYVYRARHQRENSNSSSYYNNNNREQGNLGRREDLHRKAPIPNIYGSSDGIKKTSPG